MGRRTAQFVLSAVAIFAAGCGGFESQNNPLQLSILKTLSLPAGYQGSGIAVQGSAAYVTTMAIGSQTGARDLVIVSVATPSAPTILSTTSSGLTSDMEGVVVSGNYAYVPFGSTSSVNFQVWNVANPASPSIVGTTTISCPAGMYPFNNPALYGNYVYVSCWQSEVTATGSFAIVDVTNPASPVVARSVSVTATYQPISFAIWQQNLYVVATQGGSSSDYALLYSIADPLSPDLLSMESLPHSPQWVAAQAAAALFPIYDGKELEVVDFSSPSSPHESSASLDSCSPMRVAVYPGNLALVTCDSPGGLAEVNVEIAGQPTYVKTLLSGTVFNFVAVSGSYVYAVDANGNFETVGP